MEPSILVAGETLIDFIPETRGPLAAVERFDRRAGGAPANVAVRLSQLGETPWFWTRVGPDPFGDYLVDALADRGLPGRFVERDSDAETTLAFVGRAEDPDGDDDTAFTFYRDGTADTRLRTGTVPDEALESVDWVYVGGVPLASEPSRSALRDLVDRARDCDCTVCFDPNARPELWTDADFETEVRRLLDRCDVVSATPADLARAGFDAGDRESLAEAVTDAGPSTVFLTLGEAGAYAAATDAAPWGPSFESHGGFAVDAVDTTGAGDAFTAGVLAAFVRGERDLERVLASGNAVGAASTRSVGGMGPLGDVDGLLDAD